MKEYLLWQLKFGKSEAFFKSRQAKGFATALDEKPELQIEDEELWNGFNILLSGGVVFSDVVKYCEVIKEPDILGFTMTLQEMKLVYDEHYGKKKNE